MQTNTDPIEHLLNVHDAYNGEAHGSENDGGELSRQRTLSIQAFDGINIEPQPKGRSQVQTFTVFETIQLLLPSLCRIFAGGDDVVEFDPMGPDDEDAAKQESVRLNHMVVKKNNWFLTVITWIQDALLTKNAYCLASMEEKLITETEEYKGQTEMQVTAILDDEGMEVLEQSIYPDPDFEPQPITDPETGEPMIDLETQDIALEETPNLIDIKVRKTTPRKKLKYTVLPPEHCVVSSSTPDFTLDDCPYFEYWDNMSISDIRSLGYDIEDDIGEDGDRDTLEDNARDDLLQDQINHDQNNNPDRSTRLVKTRFTWMRHDQNGDGIAEMVHFVRVGQEILVKKGEDDGVTHVSQIPVASIVPFINTHRHIGKSVSDLVFDLQRITTAILRQGLDSLYYANNPRPIATNKVNMDDLLVSRPGSPIRIDSDLPDVQGHVSALPMPFIFPQAQEGLNYMEGVRDQRVGVNRQFQGIDEGASNDHDRIGQLASMASQRVEQIARIMANGFERLFKISHELIIKDGAKSQSLKINGEWVEFDPTQWKTGRDMTVVAPFAAGNKDSMLNRLMLIRGIHSEAAAAGHPMVQPDDSYELAKEISKAADLPDYKFFTDPATVEPPEEGPDHTMIALEIESQKIASKDEENRLDHEFKMRELDVESELDKYKADLAAEVDLIVAGAKDDGQIKLEQVRASLRDQTENGGKEVRSKLDSATKGLESLVSDIKQVTEDLQKVRDDAEAPIEIVRDKKGKITGKNVNGKFIPIKRTQ